MVNHKFKPVTYNLVSSYFISSAPVAYPEIISGGGDYPGKMRNTKRQLRGGGGRVGPPAYPLITSLSLNLNLVGELMQLAY